MQLPTDEDAPRELEDLLILVQSARAAHGHFPRQRAEPHNAARLHVMQLQPALSVAFQRFADHALVIACNRHVHGAHPEDLTATLPGKDQRALLCCLILRPVVGMYVWRGSIQGRRRNEPFGIGILEDTLPSSSLSLT